MFFNRVKKSLLYQLQSSNAFCTARSGRNVWFGQHIFVVFSAVINTHTNTSLCRGVFSSIHTNLRSEREGERALLGTTVHNGGSTAPRRSGRKRLRPMLPRITYFCAEIYEIPGVLARPPPPPGPGATPLNADDKEYLPTAMDEHYGAGGRTASAPLSEALNPSKQDMAARSPSLRPPPGERNFSSDEHEKQLMLSVGAWLDPHAAPNRRRAAARAHIREWTDEEPFPPLPVAHNVQLLDEEDENEPAKHDLQVEYVASSCAVAHGERERQGSVDSVTVRNQLGEWVDISTSGLKLTITTNDRFIEDAPPPATLQEGVQRAATLVLGFFDLFLVGDATSRPLHFARSQSRLE